MIKVNRVSYESLTKDSLLDVIRKAENNSKQKKITNITKKIAKRGKITDFRSDSDGISSCTSKLKRKSI